MPLTTTRTYVGLGFRFPKSMDRAARFLFPDGRDSTPVRNTEKVTRDRWCACVGPVDGKTVTVAMFSHPGNYRHPASWFTMSDGLTYMTATLNLPSGDLTSSPRAATRAEGGAASGAVVRRRCLGWRSESWRHRSAIPALAGGNPGAAGHGELKGRAVMNEEQTLNRRQFIRASAASALAGLALPSLLRAGDDAAART